MPTTFTYKVRDRSGRVIEGSLEAETQTAVVGRLREMGYAPLLVQEQRATLGQKELHLPWGTKVKPKDIAIMARQFATMINSGLSLLRALNILADQTENKRFARVLAQVRADVERGSSLSQAFGKHPDVFNRLFIAMVRAGETSGMLDETLVRMAEAMEKQVALRHKIKSAMTYPVVVFGVVLLILSAMLIFVVPTFKELYADLGGQLPVFTRALIKVSDTVRSLWYVWVILIGGGSYGFRRWIKTDRGRGVWDAVKLKIPIFGALVHKSAISRYSRTLSALMHSGVPILQALDIVRETVGNTVVANAVAATQTSVKEGASIAKPLEQHAIFPPMVTQMMLVGEETGALDSMLDKISDFYDQEIDATVDALTSLIEPALIIVMGVGVGLMVIALYMPMFNIINLIE